MATAEVAARIRDALVISWPFWVCDFVSSGWATTQYPYVKVRFLSTWHLPQATVGHFTNKWPTALQINILGEVP